VNLLYSGAMECSPATFKRLLVMADKVIFMDRPSVNFGGWGTVGIESWHRSALHLFKGKPVELGVFAPPAGMETELYLDYARADFDNKDFRITFLDGLRSSKAFAEKYVKGKANYGSGSGEMVRRALADDRALDDVRLDLSPLDALQFRVDSHVGRVATLRMLLADASVRVTSAMLAAVETESIPVADDPHSAKLLALRSTSSQYVGGTARVAPLLGLEIVRAAIPDGVLEKIDIEAIIEYREKTKDAYAAWTVELNRLAASIDALEPSEVPDAVMKLVVTDVVPKLVEHRNAMRAVGETMFARIWKASADLGPELYPTLSMAFAGGLGWTGAIMAFLRAFQGITPAVVDGIIAKRQAQRNHAVAYLAGLSSLGGD